MTVLRVIDALQLPEVLTGSRWLALPRSSDTLHGLSQQIVVVDPGNQRMYWCDGTYHPAAIPPSYFSSEARLTLSQLLGTCTLVDRPTTGETPS